MEIVAIGGYGEIGRNSTAIKIGEDVFILDLGLHVPNYVKLTQVEEIEKLSEHKLIAENAIPNIEYIKDWRDKVKAIVIGHAHLDHIGAVPFLASKFKAPILCTPFAALVLKSILSDLKKKFPNKIIPISPNSKVKIGSTEIEFISITHSTPQTILILLKNLATNEKILYANDFKLDVNPTLGRKASLEKIKSFSPDALIIECLYADDYRKMPSESIAAKMLEETLYAIKTQNLIILTTFASHVARIKKIIDIAFEIERKPIIIGRSFAKYLRAAEKTGLISLRKVELIPYKEKAKKILRIVQSAKGKFLLIVSGHQGEPGSLLGELVDGKLPLKLESGDIVIFSSTIIPAELNIQNRAALEQKLSALGVRIFKDLHVSGHCAREDLRDFILAAKPKNLFPTHGDEDKIEAFKSLAAELNYILGKNLFVLKNGDRKEI